ncbi:MAG: ABC transporter substrate-binding protein [Bryobacterales bacterium]|nr:ABC transporter substrate-binding protein [Bryobacterales bacterium]
MIRLVALAVLALLSGCGRRDVTASPRAVCNPSAPSDQVRFTHSIQLKATYRDGYKIVDFQPSVYTQETIRLLLVPCDSAIPRDIAADLVVRTPVSTVVTANYGMNSALEALGLADRVVGVGSFRGVTSPRLKQRITEGKILEVGGGTHSNIEKTLALAPDLFLTFYSAYPQFNMHPKLWETGLRAVPLSDHTEPTPLARAEWIKFLALFFDKEREANRIFNEVVERYQRVAQITSGIGERPQVLAGFISSRDVWHTHGGQNYMAALIHDAGAEYFWKDQIHGSLVYVGFERMFDAAVATESWVTGGFLPPTLGVLRKQQPALAWLRPVQQENVLNPGKGLAPFAPMPYHDQSLDKPDAVLADLIHLLHPERLPDHRPVFFERLPK